MPLSSDRNPRLRAVSTASAVTPDDEDLATLIRTLGETPSTSWTTFKEDLEQNGALPQLRYMLKDETGSQSPRDSFRRAGGFQVIIGCLRSLVEAWESQAVAEDTKYMIQILAQVLTVLEAALHNHPGNNKYFRTRVENGGWACIQKTLARLQSQLQNKADETFLDFFYGVLYATATGEDLMTDVYISLRKTHPMTTTDPGIDMITSAEDQLYGAMDDMQDIVIPEMLTVMLELWLEHVEMFPQSTKTINFVLPISLHTLLNLSRQNVVDAHTAGLLKTTISLLFNEQLSAQERTLYRKVALLLCQEGVTSLDDAALLFSKAGTSLSALSFLLEAVRISRQPPCVQFDLSRHGCASIELPTLKKPFPSIDTAGYTIALWARFDRFDTQAHTTLFGAFDRSQTCFVLAYLEKDSRHLILQTAIRGSRPSVRFKTVKFEPGRWYHICITHKKPRTTSSSKAALFIDGEFSEQVKANFPSTAQIDKTSGPGKVQAFLGTPQDLSPTSADESCTSLWSLASAMLFQDILSDDMITIIFHLGPRYHGNLQDCLGSFQTYAASAALNMRNEILNAGTEQASHLMIAIRQKASTVLGEDLILLNISPAAILDGDDRNAVDETQLVRSLSKTAAKNLVAYTRSGMNAIAINGAVPAINEALVQSNGVALLMGQPTVTVPQSLDDVTWRLGGCAPIGLGLVHRARTTEEVALAVEMLYETIRENWRNSEVMERNSGYGILSGLVRDKLGLNAHAGSKEMTRSIAAIPTPNLDRNGLALRLLQSTLSFLGYDDKEESNSIINNPLAYKILLIDTNVWRTHSLATQKLYFQQLQVFAEGSRCARFNLKRFTRMRVLRRLLEALKADTISRSVMPLYASTIKMLLPSSMSAEVLRSIALFITYSVHKRNGHRPRKYGRSRASSDAASGTSTPVDSINLTQFEIGVEVLKMYSEILCAKGDLGMIKKFAKTVTNKWLLYLLSETSPEVVVLSVRIIARLLVIHGDAYVKKFKDKSGGFTVICHRLRRWWHLPALWPACFAILFGVDVGNLDLDRPFDLFSFVELFDSKKAFKVVHPDMFEVIIGMLQSGLKTIVASKDQQAGDQLHPHQNNGPEVPERLSMSTMAPPNPFLTLVTAQHISTFNTVVQFLADLQSRSPTFREFAMSSSYVQDLLYLLFPVVVGTDVVDASVELDARDSMLSFDGADVIVRPLSSSSPQPTIKPMDIGSTTKPVRGKAFRRGSSFVLVTRDATRRPVGYDEASHSQPLPTGLTRSAEVNGNHSVVQGVLELVVSLFVDQILTRKDFTGIGLFLKTPPGFVEHQSYFESWILRNTVSQLSNAIALNQKVLCETKVLLNLARFLTHLGDAVFEGWFIGGAESVLDLSASVLEYLQLPDIAAIKSVRLCSQAISTIRSIVFRVVLLNLSQIHGDETLSFLRKLTFWQNVLLASGDPGSNHLQHICYMLYGSLVSDRNEVRMAAADLWRIILVQKPNEAAIILNQTDTAEQKNLVSSFEKLAELDNETFLSWLDHHRTDLDFLFFETLSKSWDVFVGEENTKTEDSARSRIVRRREKLKIWSREEKEREQLIGRHEITFDHWTTNIYLAENLKYQRLLQDQQDDTLFNQMAFSKMDRELGRTTGLFTTQEPRTWRIDQTEGRNRMRMRLIEDFSAEKSYNQPRRKGSERSPLRLETKGLSKMNGAGIIPTPTSALPTISTSQPSESVTEPFPHIQDEVDGSDAVDIEESFELVEDPNEGQDDFEDKNRKVMRSLHRGDQVKHVSNVSRITGLEAVEGLLILGKDYIYLIDNFFQRADGEIVNVWQAPQEERDSYVRMISGRDVAVGRPEARNDEHETRSWKWSDIISISKRRFLFRDVAMEIFFGDGRSYLLTVFSPKIRNDMYAMVNAKAPQYGGIDSPQSEVAWRYETLKSAEDEPLTFGARFASVFTQTPSLTATRKWQKGEMSNFHYLMLINTLAGRTYNDLTQYPVFPWVIADYESEELDLTDAKSFRDLSKPMGCQYSEREADFRERYKQFAEMGDHNSPAFHYGTHYSSAMIVTSYLIRLQPFVKSYLLLQGGTFDHADRMFFSVQQAWRSASKINMTDVRELTPEFFYLPEFLTNPNGYDFGTRQNSQKSIGNVELPPWAKGDPHIFIAKQREALESSHVSKNLHKWIDLIFGHKQKGEAAVEAVNVFHHLSYQGAKNLDAIEDPLERLATIGIIHNFGQTPYQIFQKSHPAREQTKHKYKRLDTAAESLTRIPGTLLNSEERVSSLSYSWKSDKLLCSGAFRLNIPPHFDKYMEWGFSDNSVRFYAADTRRLIGLFEHLHIGQLSCALFADSKTLITSGTDCTVAVWSVSNPSGKAIDLQPRSTLFGHRHQVTVLALSRSLNALLSCSTGGEVLLWDLNRCEFVRRIDWKADALVECALINDVTGNIVLCHGSKVTILTLNGDPLLCQETSEKPSVDDNIISVACYEGAENEWLERDILLTGHKRGTVKVWNKTVGRNGGFELELIRQLNHVDPAREDGGNVTTGISCILAMPQVVYTGDEDGRVCEWNCVQRY